MKTESKLHRRAISKGPEAFSRKRIQEADKLRHRERIGPYTLVVQGGLGAFSMGTSATLSKGKKVIKHTFVLPSWVYDGRETAIRAARNWASV